MNASVVSISIALVAAFAYVLLEKNAPDFAFLLSLAAALILIVRVIPAVQIVLESLSRLEQRTDSDAYRCLLRCTGIVLLTDYTRTLCEEAGAGSIAWCTALAGRILALTALQPLLEEIGQKIGRMFG